MLGAVEVTSLGYRTDLMIRALEGSVITDHGDCIVVRSPANPAFWWGNFLLLAAPHGPGQSGRWLARFAAEFPDAAHVALGIDVTDAREVQTAEFLEAGLRLDLSTVLTASILFHTFHASFWLDFWSIWPDRIDMTDAYHRVLRAIGRPAPPPRSGG